MVVLRSSAARPPRMAARDSRCRRPPFDLLDSSSEFISLEAPGLRSHRVWTRSGSARAAVSRGARRAEEAKFSSGNIECFNGHSLRSMRKNMQRCSDSSFDKSMEILSENVNRHFSRQLAKPKSGPKKEDYKEVSRPLKTRADAKAAEQVHEENGDLELRRSCRLRQSRYSNTNESVLFDKLITNTAEAVLQKMDDMEKMRRRRRMGDLEEFQDTEEESLDMERTDEEIADNQGGSSEESEAKEDDGEDTRKRYSFRQRKTVERYQAPLQKPRQRKMYFSDRSSPVRQRDSCKGTNRRRHTVPSSDSSSSSDDEEDFERQRKNRNLRRSLPVNFRKSDLKGVNKDRMKIGASLADVDPVQIDCSVRFDGVGGLADHISALKEMVVFPLLYPEVFERFKIQPPRGCLFYGPPGTGKTLVARALANECSQGDRRVAFFMRKGADCLSKWVGESERQLRLLFDQAYQMRPSIIFFDEIDGLAPVRSSKQDQVHSSVVSTLLALMDGLDSRGEVVVIGATNRLDSIDPALRRPGRFDREFLFSLPNKEARKEIFKIHTRDWTLKPLDKFLEELAEKCVGYCGADIKALCAEAALCALRRRYPQIYERSEKLQLDIASIKITAKDFVMAMQKTVPASQRAVASPGRALSPILKPLLENTLERILQALQRVFPHAELALKKDQQQGNDVIDSEEESPSIFEENPTHKIPDREKAEFLTLNRNPRCQPTSFRPRFLLVEDPGCGQAFHLAPAVIHALEKFPVYTLDLPALFVSITSPEETCAQLMREAQRTAPSIIYVPQIPLWWETVGPTVKAVFTTLLQNIPTFAPVLLLATTDVEHGDLPEEIKALFNNDCEEVFKIQWPTCAERRSFFEDLVMKQAAEPPASKNNSARQPLEVLPVAPPPKPRQLTEEEIKKLEEQEEDTLRELRIYLRDVTHRLVIDRRFRAFTKPVDPEEVPDYNAVVKQPMDLSTVLSKIDMHQYPTARDFLKDIDLICSNALEYNPAKDPGDRLLRHRACALRDTAYSIVREEMDEEFEQRCQEIKESRQQRGSDCASSYFCVMPKEDSVPGCKKTDPKCNEKLKMLARPVDVSTPCSKDKSKRKRKRNRESSSITAKKRNIQFNKENKIPENQNEVESNEESNTDCTEFPSSQDIPIEEHENVLQERQKNGTENERERVLLVSKSPSGKKREHLDLREQSEMPDCQKAGTSEDGCSDDLWVHRMTRARSSQVEEKQLGCVGKAMKIGTQRVFVDYCELKQVLHSIAVVTENVSIFRMEKLYAVLSQCIYQHREDGDKNELVKAMKKEITAFSYP
ncbi:ATPase family AAA domain-containing protein 2 [Vidua macroura]|uniref:ATPase family AAA domain-containing protein 2 n=1 Tax=Vidua chalybeata TaxID=81927 RepID=UPI0023A80C02|nr:ATPase family AAA domain-containing protein 2 [Vidua chalybeata]XP_053833926.1 ATPase family AAA domain-containing protein 2 [Vidua macroura]